MNNIYCNIYIYIYMWIPGKNRPYISSACCRRQPKELVAGRASSCKNHTKPHVQQQQQQQSFILTRLFFPVYWG